MYLAASWSLDKLEELEQLEEELLISYFYELRSFTVNLDIFLSEFDYKL